MGNRPPLQALLSSAYCKAISVVCSFDAGGKRFYDPYPIEDVHNDRVPQNGKSARMNCTPNPGLPTGGSLLTEWAFYDVRTTRFDWLLKPESLLAGLIYHVSEEK